MISLAAAAAGGLLGAILGSFIATLCLRWPEGRGVGGRSACDRCGQAIPPARLIPLVSFAFSRGQARCCGARIDPFHPKVEAAAALIGAIALGLLPSSQGLALALFGWLLLPLFLLDLRHFWLPDRLTLLLAVGGLALGGFLAFAPLTERLIAALVAWSILALLALAYRRLRGREGLGGGDPKLLAAIAMWLGAEATVQTLLLAALIGLAEALLRRRSASDAQPLGTYLCVAGWLVAVITCVGRWP